MGDSGRAGGNPPFFPAQYAGNFPYAGNSPAPHNNLIGGNNVTVFMGAPRVGGAPSLNPPTYPTYPANPSHQAFPNYPTYPVYQPYPGYPPQHPYPQQPQPHSVHPQPPQYAFNPPFFGPSIGPPNWNVSHGEGAPRVALSQAGSGAPTSVGRDVSQQPRRDDRLARFNLSDPARQALQQDNEISDLFLNCSCELISSAVLAVAGETPSREGKLVAMGFNTRNSLATTTFTEVKQRVSEALSWKYDRAIVEDALSDHEFLHKCFRFHDYMQIMNSILSATSHARSTASTMAGGARSVTTLAAIPRAPQDSRPPIVLDLTEIDRDSARSSDVGRANPSTKRRHEEAPTDSQSRKKPRSEADAYVVGEKAEQALEGNALAELFGEAKNHGRSLTTEALSTDFKEVTTAPMSAITREKAKASFGRLKDYVAQQLRPPIGPYDRTIVNSVMAEHVFEDNLILFSDYSRILDEIKKRAGASSGASASTATSAQSLDIAQTTTTTSSSAAWDATTSGAQLQAPASPAASSTEDSEFEAALILSALESLANLRSTEPTRDTTEEKDEEGNVD